MYPPMIEPAKAQDANSMGEVTEDDRNAVRSNSTRSVLPGSGIGTTDESTTARKKSPTPPRCINQPRKCEGDFAPAAAAFDEVFSTAFANASHTNRAEYRMSLNSVTDDGHACAHPLRPPVQTPHSQGKYGRTPAGSFPQAFVLWGRTPPKAIQHRWSG